MDETIFEIYQHIIYVIASKSTTDIYTDILLKYRCLH